VVRHRRPQGDRANRRTVRHRHRADATLIGLTALSRFADRGLKLLADVVVRPTLGEADFVRVRQLRLNRLIQLRDMPGVIADRAFARLLYGDSPYGHTPLGKRADAGAAHGR